MLHTRPLTWILLIMGPFTFLAKIQPLKWWVSPKKNWTLAFFSTVWCAVLAVFLQCNNSTSEAFRHFCKCLTSKDSAHSVAEFKTADRVSTAASQWCELKGISLWLLGLWGRTVLADYFFPRAPGDLHKALMRKEIRSKRKAAPRQRLVFACDGLPHCWKARFFYFFFHLLEQLWAVHLHAVGQITSIKLETVMFQLPFSTFFPPVKLLCAEFEIYLHFNLSSL